MRATRVALLLLMPITRAHTAPDSMSPAIGTRISHAKSCLRTADAVCFDVDSTVVTSEGIDDLARFLGCGEKVKELTAKAMGGSMPYHEALELRLNAMRPSETQVATMLREEPLQLTPGIAELITALHGNGQDVYLVSGGFRQMIEPVAARLGISNSNIFANTLLFDRDGAFADHLRSEPTSRAGGKAKVVAELKASRGYKTVVMIGDGATDMEARDIPGGADAFIGFGGIAVREAVREGADWFVDDFGLLTEQVKGLSAALARSPTVAILANLPPSRAAEIGRALVDSGVTILEVPLRGDEAQMLESVRILAEAVGERAIVGAGTVLDVIQVREVKAAGARLIVAPNVDAAVIGAAKAHGLLCIPGVFTPTEALLACSLGADALKWFPTDGASPRMLKAMCAVLPKEVPILGVGGVDATNVDAWWAAGASGFGIGSAIWQPSLSTEKVAERAKRFVAAVDDARYGGEKRPRSYYGRNAVVLGAHLLVALLAYELSQPGGSLGSAAGHAG